MYNPLHHYQGLRGRNNIPNNRRNQIVSLFLGFLYCVYALLLLDTNNNLQDEYLPSQPYHDGSHQFQILKPTKEKLVTQIIHNEENHRDDDTKVENYQQNLTYSDVIPPPYIQMCSYLKPRLEHAHKKYKAEMRAQELGIHTFGLNLESIPELNANMPEGDELDYIVVGDNEHVCEEPKYTAEALLDIYASVLLSEAATRFHLNVEYKHECLSDNLYNIQDRIQGDLFGDNIELRDSTLIDVEAIQDICNDCLVSQNLKNDINCILFAKPVSLQSMSPGFETIFPLLKENVRLIAEKWKNEDQSTMLNNYVVQFHPPPSLPVIPYNISDSGNLTNTIAPIDESKASGLSSSYVVYISCINEDCNDVRDSIAVPFKFYTERINHKDDVSSVSIIVSESCSTMIDGCLSYGQALYSMFIQHFTKAQIELIQSPSTYHIYSQIYLADYTVCPPNHACILPAMLSDGLALIAIDDKKHISQFSKELVSSTNTIFLTNVKQTSVTKLDHKFLMSKSHK